MKLGCNEILNYKNIKSISYFTLENIELDSKMFF